VVNIGCLDNKSGTFLCYFLRTGHSRRKHGNLGIVKGFNCIASLILCGIMFAASAPLQAQVGEVLVIRGGTLIDPAREDLGVPGTIIVQNGLIIAVRPGNDAPPPAGAQVIDASGGYVMPGIADMNNNLRSGMPKPGGDPVRMLRSLLNWGVTTTLEPGGRSAEFNKLRAEISKNNNAYPQTFLAQGLFTTEGGWGEGYRPKTPAEARKLVRDLKAAGSFGVKLIYDDMRWATTQPFAIMDRDIAVAIIDEAHRQEMMSFAQAPIQEFAKHMVKAGVDCLINGIISEPVDAEFIDMMKRNNTCYISTLTMYQTKAGYSDWADRLEEFDINKRLNPAAMEIFRKTPTGTARLDNAAWTVERLPVLRLNLFTVLGAGIRVLIGTDAGSPGVLPGISAQLEMVMHQEAGLDPIDVLRAATSTAADVLDRRGRFGTLRDGAQADLLVLDADPRDDVGNIRKIRHVIRAGRVHK
jgi:imidazolonepropionase-like amidohydrolase